MPYDLHKSPTALRLTFSRQFLFKALELAELYGWKPRRTQPPAHIDFCALGARVRGHLKRAMYRIDISFICLPSH